ncbi:hypothetical protein CTA1_8165, partial [Colletotrichum tanaceti]
NLPRNRPRRPLHRRRLPPQLPNTTFRFSSSLDHDQTDFREPLALDDVTLSSSTWNRKALHRFSTAFPPPPRLASKPCHDTRSRQSTIFPTLSSSDRVLTSSLLWRMG